SASSKEMTLTLRPANGTKRVYALQVEDDRSSLALTLNGKTEVFENGNPTSDHCQSNADCKPGETCKHAPTGNTCVPSQPPPPPADGGNGNGAGVCANRHGGALVTFNIQGESLTIWSTNTAFINEATTLVQSGDHRTPVFDKVLDGQDCDSQY